MSRVTSDPSTHVEHSWRVLVIGVLILLMFGGPFVRQVFRNMNPYLPRWVMYSGGGLEVVRAEFYSEDESGELVRIDAASLSDEQPFLISGKRELDRVIGNLRRSELGGRAIVVDAQIGTQDGWATVYDGKRFEME